MDAGRRCADERSCAPGRWAQHPAGHPEGLPTRSLWAVGLTPLYLAYAADYSWRRDLPWNPSRLEQRLGRIKRIGQARRTVDMLNLVYHETQDEKVYQVLSRRMKDRYDIFGGLPDTIEDEWIENVEKLEEMMDEYIHLRQEARDVFEMRYQGKIDPDKDRWELCSRVLARRDVVDRLSAPW